MTAAMAVAAGALAAAVAVMVAPTAEPLGGSGLWSRAWWIGVGAVLIPAVVVMPLAAVGIAVAVAAGLAVSALITRRRCDQHARVTALRVVETCERIASELSAGQPPGAALTRCAREWPLLAPVAEAERVGLDVPDALRGVAAVPGAGQLRVVAAAWQVAHASGGAVAPALDRVALDLREDLAAQRIVAGELASARATARLVALLPVAALMLGSGVGGDPWEFLLRTPIGLGCLGTGVGLGLVGLWWIDGIARSVMVR